MLQAVARRNFTSERMEEEHMKRQLGNSRVIEIARDALLVWILLVGMFSGSSVAEINCDFDYRSPELDYNPKLVPANGTAPLAVKATWSKNWSSAYDTDPDSWSQPLYETFLYLDWGDGTKESIPAQTCPSPLSAHPGYTLKNWPPQTLTHVYNRGGTYTVKRGSIAGGGDIFWKSVGTIKVASKCNFSKQLPFERCFGGIGDHCEWTSALVLAPFIYDEKTCTVQGWMSIGSILHDRCCIETNNNGVECENPDGRSTSPREWDEATWNTYCTANLDIRQWPYTFGPYPIGNVGDNKNQEFRAPKGARVNPEYAYLCRTGRCEVREDGQPKVHHQTVTGCGPYCICE
jgi:hypothetical protein